MKKIKNFVPHAHKTSNINQNKGGYPVFPEPTPPRIARHGREVVIALITVCIIMVCVARKHPLLFSHRLPLRLGAEVADRAWY